MQIVPVLPPRPAERQTKTATQLYAKEILSTHSEIKERACEKITFSLKGRVRSATQHTTKCSEKNRIEVNFTTKFVRVSNCFTFDEFAFVNF